MSDAAFNLAQLERRPSWHEHIGAAAHLRAVQKYLEAHLIHLGE